MKSTLKTMQRCTARCGARESRFSQPSMRMLPKPSVEEKNLRVVTQSMAPPLYDATSPSHAPSADAKTCGASMSSNQVLPGFSDGTRSAHMASRSFSMMSQSSP